MKPNKIFLIRHGQSVNNALRGEMRLTIADHKMELTQLGKDQSLAAGLKLHNEILKGMDEYDIIPHKIRIYCSPLLRTRQTLENMKMAISSDIESVIEDVRLIEQSWGNFKSPKELEDIEQEQMLYGQFYYTIPGGESGPHVLNRSRLFLSDLAWEYNLNENFPKFVGIIGHGFQLRTILMALLHWTPEEFESYRNMRNCEIITLELKNDQYIPIQPFLKNPEQYA